MIRQILVLVVLAFVAQAGSAEVFVVAIQNDGTNTVEALNAKGFAATTINLDSHSFKAGDMIALHFDDGYSTLKGYNVYRIDADTAINFSQSGNARFLFSYSVNIPEAEKLPVTSIGQVDNQCNWPGLLGGCRNQSASDIVADELAELLIRQ